MTRIVTVAATQMACGWDISGNIARAEKLVREAAGKGAQIALIQELFEAPYFCQDQIAEFFDLAKPLEGNPLIAHFSRLAAELGVVIPVSFFEKAGPAFFNSVAIVDADGTVLGFYRKSHIPDGPGYTEKYYFSPGDTGFKVWQTRYAKIGVGICWDQWFPEAARSMALLGAELLLYPTAIGSEPQDPTIDSAAHWQRVMQGHAAANLMPVIASNRIGVEAGRKGTELTFYGSSFIADQTGGKIAEAGRQDEAVLTASFDLDGIAKQRAAWGLFRDRRPELYGTVLTFDGTN
ncbi:N-carbamoylputrescine amidase [Rhizobium sp. SL42]|uniref:N-carbamoylputrescine amidase n=1 Tax=Rhizobium sp. SL42 TaxID=2806346 RepID=UPI001F0043D2|nr:N-carbamoylputrescine amidase [Rhizobium sp. SL42]UJW75962.1 N-carbamoylputrescine amidase [Rhizobium sp. SL42]